LERKCVWIRASLLVKKVISQFRTGHFMVGFDVFVDVLERVDFAIGTGDEVMFKLGTGLIF